jgi:GNAT superfamily N-acetyltransferase
MPDITIHPVRTKSEWLQFVKFPYEIYKHDKNWIAPLLIDQKTLLDKNKNPFYKHSDVEFFLAELNRKIIGRIAGIVNYNHNSFHNEKTGFFGFFETINDYGVARRLYDTARDWIKSKGMIVMRGPVNPSTNDTAGFLSEGFDMPPVIMMTYNPSYYIDFTEKYGMTKAKDLYAYYITADTQFPEKLIRIAEMIRKKEGVTIRNINMKNFWKEVELVKEIYNKAWSKNWGFVPMTDEEFHHLAKDLKSIVMPEFALIAEVNEQAVGFSLTIPNVNQILKPINGKLFPFGIFYLLMNFKKINEARVIVMGVIHEYQKRGIDAVFHLETLKAGKKLGYRGGELSWVLEDNIPMIRTAEMVGAKIYKKYRIYEMSI